MQFTSFKSLLAIGLVCLTLPIFAQASNKKTIAVDTVKVGTALQTNLSQDDRGVLLKRVSEALDRHLVTTLVASRKFTVVGRRDLESLIGQDSEQAYAEGGIIGKNEAQVNALTGANYKLVVFIDSFQENSEVATFNGIQRMRRNLQLSAQATIYDTTTGEILDAANIQTEKADVIDLIGSSNRPGGRLDGLIPVATRDLAEKITARLLTLLYPVKIVDVDGTSVTLNRGEGFFTVGEVVYVTSRGKTITDPDTGETLKIKGKITARIQITDIEPNYAQGEIIEGNGVTVGGQISRP